MTEKIKIERQEPLEMDTRGRVTIPANIRAKHGIDPEDDQEIWIEVEIKYAEIMDSGENEGEE